MSQLRKQAPGPSPRFLMLNFFSLALHLSVTANLQFFLISRREGVEPSPPFLFLSSVFGPPGEDLTLFFVFSLGRGGDSLFLCERYPFPVGSIRSMTSWVRSVSFPFLPFARPLGPLVLS